MHFLFINRIYKGSSATRQITAMYYMLNSLLYYLTTTTISDKDSGLSDLPSRSQRCMWWKLQKFQVPTTWLHILYALSCAILYSFSCMCFFFTWKAKQEGTASSLPDTHNEWDCSRLKLELGTQFRSRRWVAETQLPEPLPASIQGLH